MRKITKLLMGLAVVCGLGLVFTSGVYAVDPALDSITISPVSAKLQLSPGETVSGTFKVINSGAADLVFKVYATPFYVNDNDYDNLQFSGETSRTQIARWISFDQTEYTLAPSATAQIAYHVNVPASVPAGGQYAAIMAESVPVNGDGVTTSSRVGMLVFSSIEGTTIEKGEFLSSTIQSWYQTSPVKTSVNVKNSGNTDFTISTTLKVRNLFGGEVYDSGVRENQILPETSREVSLDWDSDMRVGFYTIEQNVKFLNFNETYTRVVLLMPVWLLLVIIIIVVAIVALIIVKMQKNSVAKKSTKKSAAKKSRR